MEYKIEYTPAYSKKDLTAQRMRNLSLAAMVAGLLLSSVLLWCNRAMVVRVVNALEQMAHQVRECESVADVIDTFSQSLQGDIRG